jgi:hypothetical protein
MSQVSHALRSVAFSLTDGTLHNSSESLLPVESASVSARAGGKAVFTIENNDDDAYDVWIPLAEFAPHDGGPRNPINEQASGNTSVRLAPHDVEVLVYIMKDRGHFPFSESHKTFRYKYNIYYTKGSREEPTRMIDPDLEVSP